MDCLPSGGLKIFCFNKSRVKLVEFPHFFGLIPQAWCLAALLWAGRPDWSNQLSHSAAVGHPPITLIVYYRRGGSPMISRAS